MTSPKMLGSPITLELRGDKYELHPLTTGDIADFENKIRSTRLEAYLNAANATGAPPSERSQIINDILQKHVSFQETLREMFSASGLIYTLYLSIKKGVDGFSLEHAGRLIGQDNWSDVAKVLEILILGQTTEKKKLRARAKKST
ncbi:MAG: hypothetical protein ABIH23_05980 [bacterium]